jgi:type II secretory pathway component PulJ
MRSRGFTLLEALLTLGLVSTILVLTAGLLRSYSTTSRAVRASSAKLSSLESLVKTLSTELKGSVTVSSPSSQGSTSNTLVFQRVDIGVTDRLTYIHPGISPNPPKWEPYDLPDTSEPDDFLAEVTYQLVGNRLERSVKPAKSVYQPATKVAEGIEQFWVEWFNDDSLEARLTIAQTTNTKTFHIRVLRKLR